MGSTTHSIEVNAPLRVVYNQWTQFEEFPRFMEGVDEVRQDGPKRLFWKARIAGKDKQWEAEITEQVPDTRIAWVSVDGTPNTGEVSFESLELERTLITLTMEYEPEGFLERAGDVLGIPSGQVEEDLNRFRDFIEQTGKETGGWRGRIGLGPDSIAGAVRDEGTPNIKIVREKTDREIAPEAGIETGRTRGEQDESFPTREHPSARSDKHRFLAAERLGDPFETVADESEIETTGAQGERSELFPSSQQSHDLADEPTSPAVDRLDEPGNQSIKYQKGGVIRPTGEQIARRAYELYLDRGQTPGHELDDWLKAEWELSENWGQ